MTDFLAGLLDRALQRAPVIERRRPSLFEPAPGADARRQGEIWPSTEAVEESESVAMPEVPKPRRRPAGDREPERGRLEAADLPRAAAAVSRIFPRREDHPELSVQPERRIAEPAAAAPIERIVTLVEREVEQPRPPVQPAPRVQENAAVPLAPAPASVRRMDRSDGGPLREEAGSRPPQFSPVVPPPARPVVVTPLIQPAARRAPAPRPLPAIVQRERSSPPTIQVTIGRIEVRASSAPAVPSRAARPSGPKLDLDDYLKARSGGSR
jgi:hypothetical protein